MPSDLANRDAHTMLFNPQYESANMIIQDGVILASHRLNAVSRLPLLTKMSRRSYVCLTSAPVIFVGMLLLPILTSTAFLKWKITSMRYA